MSASKTINFNQAKLERLRTRYKKAAATGEKQFDFEGSEFVTGYAKYVIQYLDMQFNGKEYDSKD